MGIGIRDTNFASSKGHPFPRYFVEMTYQIHSPPFYGADNSLNAPVEVQLRFKGSRKQLQHILELVHHLTLHHQVQVSQLLQARTASRQAASRQEQAQVTLEVFGDKNKDSFSEAGSHSISFEIPEQDHPDFALVTRNITLALVNLLQQQMEEC